MSWPLEFGTGVPPDDPYIYALSITGEPMIARRGEREFKTLAQTKDEIAVRQAHSDQVQAGRDASED